MADDRYPTNNTLLDRILSALGGDGATGLDDLNTAIGTPSDEAWDGSAADATVISLLKTIATNTATT